MGCAFKKYSSLDYVQKYEKEDYADYSNRILRLSDISYVLGNFRSFISKTGLAASNYLWKEQLILADALTSVHDNNKIIGFGRNFGKDGIRTFLSVEQGGKEMGDKILTLGEKLPKDIVEKVFQKYAEIIDTADSVKKTLENSISKEVLSSSEAVLSEIRESLLFRAQKLLLNFYDKKDLSNDELLKTLDRYKTEVLLYADTYKKLNESGKEIKLEDIKGTEITVLSQQEKAEIANNLWDITIANRPFLSEQEKIKRKDSFMSTIENKDSDFYILKFNNEIVAFCSFTLDQNGELYAESLNVESEIKGAQIGSEFFPSVLDKVKKLGKDIYGHVHEKNKNTLPYYERLGFVVKEVNINGEIKYEIRIPAEKVMQQAA